MAETWFTPKEWKARLVEFAGRRLLRNVANGESTTYDVSRSEGQVSQEGDAFNTKNMNDLEQRVANGFADAKTAVDTLNRDLKFPDGTGFYPDIKDGVHGYNTDSKRGADTFIPFNKIPEEMIVYIGGTNESGSASFSREFLDAMGYTKMEIHPNEKALAIGHGISTFNGFETFSTASRVEYNITSVKTVDVSNTSPYSKGVTILQPGDRTTVSAIGYVRFLKS